MSQHNKARYRFAGFSYNLYSFVFNLFHFSISFIYFSFAVLVLLLASIGGMQCFCFGHFKAASIYSCYRVQYLNNQIMSDRMVFYGCIVRQCMQCATIHMSMHTYSINIIVIATGCMYNGLDAFQRYLCLFCTRTAYNRKYFLQPHVRIQYFCMICRNLHFNKKK